MACVRAPYEKSGFVRSLTDNVARESSPYPQAKWYELDKIHASILLTVGYRWGNGEVSEHRCPRIQKWCASSRSTELELIYSPFPAVSARAMVGGNDDLLPLQFRSIARAGGLEGQIHVVTNEANEIVSYAIWFPPGTDLFASWVEFRIRIKQLFYYHTLTVFSCREAQRRLGFNEMMEKIDNNTRQWFKDTVRFQ